MKLPFEPPEGFEDFQVEVRSYLKRAFPDLPFENDDLKMISLFTACVMFDPKSHVRRHFVDLVLECQKNLTEIQ